MTTVSREQGLEGYPVRLRHHGPIIGHARNVGVRRWRSACASCEVTFAAASRVDAGGLLGHHHNTVHTPARRVRLLR